MSSLKEKEELGTAGTSGDSKSRPESLDFISHLEGTGEGVLADP